MLSASERMAFIKKMRNLPDQLKKVISNIPKDDLEMAYLPGEWSIAQNVHHLADAHMNAFYRFKQILLHEQPELRQFDQKNWARTVESTLPNIEDSLLILRGLHNRWCTLMEALGENDWERRGMHKQVGVVTLEDLLMSYTRHGETHLQQIAQTLQARIEHLQN